MNRKAKREWKGKAEAVEKPAEAALLLEQAAQSGEGAQKLVASTFKDRAKAKDPHFDWLLRKMEWEGEGPDLAVHIPGIVSDMIENRKLDELAVYASIPRNNRHRRTEVLHSLLESYSGSEMSKPPVNESGEEKERRRAVLKQLIEPLAKRADLSAYYRMDDSLGVAYTLGWQMGHQGLKPTRNRFDLRRRDFDHPLQTAKLLLFGIYPKDGKQNAVGTPEFHRSTPGYVSTEVSKKPPLELGKAQEGAA